MSPGTKAAGIILGSVGAGTFTGLCITNAVWFGTEDPLFAIITGIATSGLMSLATFVFLVCKE